MNAMNWVMSTFKNPRLMRKVMKNTKMFQRRRNNRGLTLLSLLGLGTALGVAASRNRNMNIRKPIQNIVQRAQNFTSGRNQMQPNLATTEFAKEIMGNNNINNRNQNK